MKRMTWILVVAALALPALCGAQDVGQRQYAIPLEGSPATGQAGAPVTIVEFVDFLSPACQAAAPTLGKILEAYQGKIRLAIKNLPGNSLESHVAAKAAIAAGAQGKYWEMHDLLLASGAQSDRDGLVKMAAKLGLEIKSFEADLDGARLVERLEQDKALAAAMKISETPAFFINDRRFAGTPDLASLRAAIDEELASTKP
jgi:protein-disulfide isomerase